MSLKESLKAEGQKEKEKLKNMSTQDKIWYIWEYYKVHMLAAAALLFLVYLIINMIYQSTFETRLSYIVINNANAQNTDLISFNQEFKEFMHYGKKDRVEAEGSLYIQYGDRASEMEYAGMAKISALVASNELDMMIADQMNIDHYMELDAYVDLQQFLPDELWQQVKDSVYYAKDSQGRDVPCALDLNSTRFPEKTGVEITPCYLGIVSNTGRSDTILSWIRFVLEAP